MKKKITSLFAYLFFCLFVLSVLSLFVSFFSSTFSQLFSLLSQDGRIFDVFLYVFYCLGFLICLYTLIEMNQEWKEDPRVIAVILSLCLVFVFLFVFGLFGQQDRVSLLDLILLQEQPRNFRAIFWSHIGEFLVFGSFYIFFVFAPLFCAVLKVTPNPNHPFGFFLQQLRPSLNVVIYFISACSLQSYFHKGHWFFYLDLIALVFALILLLLFLKQHEKKLEFFEICNLCFLGVGIVVYALVSEIIHEANFNARYVFFAFAFVAWCAEWMMEMTEK